MTSLWLLWFWSSWSWVELRSELFESPQTSTPTATTAIAIDTHIQRLWPRLGSVGVVPAPWGAGAGAGAAGGGGSRGDIVRGCRATPYSPTVRTRVSCWCAHYASSDARGAGRGAGRGARGAGRGARWRKSATGRGTAGAVARAPKGERASWRRR